MQKRHFIGATQMHKAGWPFMGVCQMTMLRSTDINYLLYRYLVENGLEHTAYVLQKETALDLSEFVHTELERNALPSYLYKALCYTETETHLYSKKKCTEAFSLVRKHRCNTDISPDEFSLADLSQKRKKKKASAARPAKQQREKTESVSVQKEQPAAEQKDIIRLSHLEEASTCAWSPAESRLATGSSDTTAKIWSLEDSGKGHGCIVLEHNTTEETGEGLLDAECAVTVVAWAPDGQHLATGTLGGVVRIWTKDGKLFGVLDNRTAAKEHEQPLASYPIYNLKWSPDGTHLLGASAAAQPLLWSPLCSSYPEPVQTGHTDSILDVAWKDNDQFATCSRDKTACIYSCTQPTVLTTLAQHHNEVNTLAWAPSFSRLATGSDDATARIWNTETGDCLFVLAGHTDAVFCVCWLEVDTALLASSSYDRTIRLWTHDSGELLRVLSGHDGPVHTLAPSPCGRHLLSGSSDKTTRLWNPWAAEDRVPETYALDGPVVDIGWSASENSFAACTTAGTVFVVRT